MLFNSLKYNNFPSFDPDPPIVGGAPATEGAVASPAEPVETPAEISETEAFALEAFEQSNLDEPEDEPLVQPVEPEGLPVETPAVTQVVEPARVPAVTPAAPAAPGNATPPGQAAATQTVQQPGSEPAVQVAPTEPDEQTLHGMANALNAQRDVFVKQLAAQKYKFTPEELTRFETEPGEFIAEVAARVQVETTQSLMRVMWSQLPGLINSTVQRRIADDSAENAFWSANPSLDRVKHKPLVDSVSPVFRKSFPTADASTFNKNVGQMVLGMLGQTALALQQQVLPSTPAVKTPGTVVRQVAPAFTPGGGHGAPASALPRAEMNPWEKLYDLTRRDDAGEFEG